MLVLGVHGGMKQTEDDDRGGFAFHDSAAVLMRDGEIIAAIEEERLDRIKHSNCFPRRAIAWCLREGRCSLRDVDVIATNSSVYHADLMTKLHRLEQSRSRLPADGRAFLSALFQREFGVDVADRLHFTNHQIAHAWSAFVASGFSDSLVVSLDGDGDGASGMILVGDRMRLTKLHEARISQSLGRWYQQLIRVVGYDRFDEYKVMGLAPYGNPAVFREMFEKGVTLRPDGTYALDSGAEWLARLDAAGRIAEARRKSEPFQQWHKDFAAALQAALERILLHVIGHYAAVTGQRRLCFAGGVAHNCTANGRLLYSGLFDAMFVQPASHDAGGAIGAAYDACVERGGLRTAAPLRHVYLGPPIGDADEIVNRLRQWPCLSYTRAADIAKTAAALLANDAVIGWVQGRSEFGPRALGNRSIVADPRPAANRERINRMIKKREAYRPFAPSVLEERAAEFFDLPKTQAELPFMIYVLRVREAMRERLGAVTHVDGTARVQTVSRGTNPLYWTLIREFEALTGIPILLNTSFNNHAEPIVDSIDDAITCFLTTKLSHLVIGDYVIERPEAAAIRRTLADLAPALPLHRQLVRRRWDPPDGETRTLYEIESRKSAFFGTPCVEISRAMFEVLRLADGQTSLAALVVEAQQSAAWESLLDEAQYLWSERVIRFEPCVRAGHEEGRSHARGIQTVAATAAPVVVS